jgi:HEAT repeat protein
MTDFQSLINKLIGSRVMQEDAVKAFTALGSEGVPHLIDALHHHEDKSLRMACVWMLNKLDDPRIEEALVWSLQNDAELTVKERIVEVIDSIDNPPLFEATVDLLMQNSSKAAKRLQTSARVQDVLQLLYNNLALANTPESREPFFHALTKLNSEHSYAQHIEWLSHAEADYRYAAAIGVEDIKYNRAVTDDEQEIACQRLTDCLLDETDAKVLAQMVRSLGSFGHYLPKGSPAITILKKLKNHSDANVAKAAERSLNTLLNSGFRESSKF